MTFLPDQPTAGLSEIFAAFPETSVPLLEYTQCVLRGPSPLEAGQRELIAAFVSGLNACGHCYGTHSGVAEAFGVPLPLVASLVEDIHSSDVDERLKPILSFARKLTLTPSRMTQADADTVFAAGWDTRALHDVISVCALFNLFNRFVSGLGIETPPELARARGHMLAEIGYSGLIEKLGHSSSRQPR